MRTLDTDICEISSYDPTGGTIVCSEPLNGYHFGAIDPTDVEYGVDMRAEVALLSRNIEITASQINATSHTASEPWGCRILISDFFETDAEMTHQVGSLLMDSVSVYRCG